MESRLLAFQAKLAASSAQAVLVTGQTNIYYLTGFWASAGMLFISDQRRVFLTDSRYSLLARQSIKNMDVLDTGTPLAEIAKLIKGDNLKVLAFDSQITYAAYQDLQGHFPGYALQAQTNFVEELRQIKDSEEITLIEKACQISDQAFLDVLDFIKPGKSELQVAHFLDFRMRELGASSTSFETIVASGYRSAMPHGLASDKLIKSGETLTLDFGCYYQHYVSDMTRTIHIGQVSDQEREIYALALEANQALIDTCRAGMTFADYDDSARSIIEQAGYGGNFSHGIGHGIGLDIHELPFFGAKAKGSLVSGMVVTDEPGIYLNDRYGVRIEDDLLITEEGCRVMTQAPKELIVL